MEPSIVDQNLASKVPYPLYLRMPGSCTSHSIDLFSLGMWLSHVVDSENKGAGGKTHETSIKGQKMTRQTLTGQLKEESSYLLQ